MREDLIILRVAARFQRGIVATFIPDKWFKAKRAELVAILKTPIEGHQSKWWAHLLDDKVGGFLTKFEKDFKSMVTFEPALESVHRRVKEAQDKLEVITESLDAVGRYGNYVDISDPTQYLTWRAAVEIREKIASTTKTFGGFFTWGWVIDEAAIERLVQQTINKATPTQIKALVDADIDRNFRVVTAFLAAVGFKREALKTVKRIRIDNFNPIKWFDWVCEVLKSNYTEQAVQNSNIFREFDMYRMKVVIDDSTVTEMDTEDYVKYIDEAHTRMKTKGFGKAWYGTFFVRCHNCGGVNPNSLSGETGGDYRIGPDTINCYSKPGKFIVKLLVHELGHRYWFKQMTSTQRAKFNSLIKVRPTAIRPSESDIPTYTIPEEKVQAAQAKIDSVAEPIKQKLELFRKSKLRWYMKILDAFSRPINDTAWDFKNEMITAVHSSSADSPVNQTVRKALLDVLDLVAEVHTTCANMSEVLNSTVNKYPDGTDFNQVFRVERGKWLDKTLDLINRTVKAAHHYVTIAVEATNEYENTKGKRVVEDWDRRFREDTRPVAPVSEYGGANIDEAFAEAFTHYVLEMDMDRDQLESFRSVFSSMDDLVTLVAQRYLQEFS